MPTERITIRLPKGFDPSKHLAALEKLVADRHGDGFEIDSIDPAAGVAYATRLVAVTEVAASEQTRDRFEVRLPRSTKVSDGERIAAKLEDQHDGMYLVEFEPYLGKAVLARLTPAEQRCRGAVAAALGVRPWDVQVAARPDGGFDVKLVRSYVPSKHDDKLFEVATAVVGAEGWYVEADPKALTASFIPGDLPTFPAKIEYPFDQPVPRVDRHTTDWALIPIGRSLGANGNDGPEVCVDLLQVPHLLGSGVSGAGKSNVANAFIYGALARGFELVVIDLPAKSVDYRWCKRYVRPSGWGCDSLASNLTAMRIAYEEGERRSKLLARHDVVKWTDLPSEVAIRPILVIVDEVTGLFALDDVPRGIPKDNPLVLEATQSNLLRMTLRSFIARTAAEMRFVGIHVAAWTQVAQQATGLPPAIRLNLGNRLLLGVNPSEGNRKLALNDPSSVPNVPLHIRNDKLAGRGVGVAELEGQEPRVVKSYFGTTEQYVAWLDRLGVPTTDQPAPTPAEIARHTPSIEAADGGGADANAGRAGDRSPSGKLRPEPTRDPVTSEVLHGFEAANEQRRRLDAAARQAGG
ncbi:MAG: FtsK/SpoIIIE domain-containing protein [Deltaproteobacteria bacterium]